MLHCKFIDIFQKNHLKLTFCLLVCLICAPAVVGQRQSARMLAYIDRYKDIAIEHQQQYGIPASITLAQGLLESSAGTSYLSRRGNNHFGIKCHNWKGESVTYDDTLRHECYRQYARPEDSFADHARFLKGRRYAPLYELDVTDYEGWAQGLKDCGYATDPQYPSKLIGIIEQYHLNDYVTGQPTVAESKPLTPDPTIGHDPNPAKTNTANQEVLRSVASLHTVHLKWGLNYVVAVEGDTYQAIASEFDLKLNKLLEFNDVKGKPKMLKKGEMVWLQKKDKRAPMGYETYTARTGDTMHAIAQKYCVRLDCLLKLNPAFKDSEPHPGDTITLR